MPFSTVFCAAVVLIIIQVYCFQTQYRFIHERCDVNRVNKSLINLHVGRCVKGRHNQLHLNISFTPKLDSYTNDDVQIKIVGYQFRSNEYRKGPIEFMLGICASIKSKQFDIPNMMSQSNIKKCPLLKGVNYYAYNIKPNETNMPPFIPDGRWMVELQVLYRNKYLVYAVNWYVAVEYPVLMKIEKH